MDEITCSTTKEEEVSRAECWRIAEGPKSSGLAMNYKEVLTDTKRQGSMKKLSDDFLGEWKNTLICCVAKSALVNTVSASR